jgi:cytochrome b
MARAISSSATSAAGRSERPATIRVWDPLVRLSHWTLVIGFTIAWLTEEGKGLHQAAGYLVLGLVALRLIWGFVGSRHARFRDFVPRPKDLLAYLKSLPSGHPRRYLGHNPAGGAMIVLLLAMLILTGFSGWLQTTDAYWGIVWVENLHAAAANLTMVLIFAHVAGVIFSSLVHRENLTMAMVTGRKQAEAAPEPDYEPRGREITLPWT